MAATAAALLFLLFIAPTVLADTELSLAEAVRQALEYSHRIKAGEHDSASARHDFNTARARRFPTLSLSAVSYYMDETESIDFPIPQVPDMEIGSKENYQADLKLSAPLYTGGKLSGSIAAAEAALHGAAYTLEARRMAVAYNCRKAYFNLMLSDIMVRSAEASHQRIKIIKDDAQNLFQNGLADSIDLLDTELAFQQTRHALDIRRTARTNASSILANLIGMASNDNITITEERSSPDRDKYNQQSSAMINRPELQALDSRIRSADQLARISAAGYFPDLSAYAGYSYGKPNRDQFNSTWNDFFMVGLSLNWTYNFGGKTRYSIKSARQSAFSARMEKRDLAEQLNLYADIALENINHAARSMAISEKEYQISQNKYRLAENKHSVGNLTINRLLELEKELTAAEQAYRASIINYYISENEYFYAVGSPEIYGGL